VDVNVQDESGLSALHLAARSGQLNTVAVLLNAGASVCLKEKRFGFFPIDEAKTPEIRELLLESWKVEVLHKQNSVEVGVKENHPESIVVSKTSDTHPIIVYFVESETVKKLSGKLAISMCPGRNKNLWKRDLRKDLSRLSSHYGINVLVSLITYQEMNEMHLNYMSLRVQEYGIESMHFALAEKHVPSPIDHIINIVNVIIHRMRDGKTVLVHCKGGKKRSSIVAMAVLVALGMSPSDAITCGRNSRPGINPDPIQALFLELFKHYWTQHKTKKVSEKSAYRFE